MKRQFGKTLQRIAALTLGVFVTLSHVAEAATNTGTGDVAGVDAALVDSNVFTLNSSNPTLVKVAYLAGGGAALTSGDAVPAGTSVDFLIYLNNEADVDIDDVTIQDALTGFTYTAGTIRVLNTTAECAATACTVGEELTIYNDVRAETAKTDGAAAGDTASFVGSTVDVGDQVQANDQQDAVANTVLAVVFTVTVD
jgi:hypothetical protein